jgi:erythromycin esterase
VIETVDPQAPLDDIRGMRGWLAGAAVVGLGESVRGARSGRQLYRVKHRLVRLLVEALGFRTIAFEDTPAVGAALDRHVRAGEGDLLDILAAAWAPWRTEEFADLVRWVRSYDVDHPGDPVGFVGVDGDEPGTLGRNTVAAHAEAGHPVVYWGGMAHVAVHGPTGAATGGASDGWTMRERLGPRYLAVGVTCHRGVGAEVLPPPPEGFAESPLGDVGIERFALDLRTEPAGEAVRSWLTAPATTRVVGPRYEPDHDADFAMTGKPLRGWFDVLVHVRDVTPATTLLQR